MININLHYGLEGYYSFKVVNKNTLEERDLSDTIASDHKNMILNSGLDSLGAYSFADMCVVGSGTSAPTVDQLYLESQLAGSTTVTTESTYRTQQSPYYLVGTRTYRFSPGTIKGTVTEVGVTSGYSKNGQPTLFSRARIVDSQGSTSSITVLEDEWLDVTYELRLYQSHDEKVLTFSALGTTHTCTIRTGVLNYTLYTRDFFASIFARTGSAFNVTYTDGVIGDSFNSPHDYTSSAGTSSSQGDYVFGSYKRDLIMTAGLDQANFPTGISTFYVETAKQSWQGQFDPPIPKTKYRTLRIVLTVSWARYATT